MRRPSSIALALVLSLTVVACGDDGAFPTTVPETTSAGGETTSPTAGTTTTATVPPEESSTSSSTTAPATTTTTTGSSAYYEVDTTDFFPDVFPGSTNGAHGSGCVTPGFDALPNGVWFGFVEALGAEGLVFDLACFFTGDAAVAAAEEDGAEAVDFYIRNQNPTTFTVPVAVGIRVWTVDATAADVTPTEIPPGEWPYSGSYQDCPSDHCAVWLYVNGGEATALVEQYLP